jgi:acyl carrier protein
MIQPVGIPGELVISGENLSRGYINRSDLNADRFIYLKYPDGRYLRGYRTGDLVKWCYDGNIEFIGRTDFQVKLRGFRIELGDIESKLLDMPVVKTAVVVLQELKPENKIISAYVVLKENSITSTEKIRRYLSARLPDYMIPAHIMILDELPLNSSGKIDRKALPLPEFVSHEKLVRPHSSFEKKLLEIWKDTLGLEELGITQNFFDVGGNSLLAVHIVSQIRKRFNIDIEPVHIMEHPNIRALAAFINETDKEDAAEEVAADQTIDMRRQAFSMLRRKRSGYHE